MNKNDAIQFYGQYIEELRKIVHSWDPHGLSRAGEISDEWDGEIGQVLRGLAGTSGPADVVGLVRRVFSLGFPIYEFETEAVGRQIWEWWSSK